MGKPLILNGLISPFAASKFSGIRRKQYRNYRVSEQDIELIKSTLISIEKFISLRTEENLMDSVTFLHEIRTSVGIVLACCEEIISGQSGFTFEEKLERTDPKTKDLFDSIGLLQEQLNLTDIITNPSSITYGKKYRSTIHKYFLKMVKLFAPRAAKRGIRIQLNGTTYAEIFAYNSFQFIPLILLDNAIKYSFSNRDIIVSLEERADRVSIKVSSVGKVVPDEYRDRIFDKHVRGPNATEEHPRGMGMGLYIARLIAGAHETSITYRCFSVSGGVGTNEFSFEIAKYVG
jgi:K+-sensing histidine kinase KdpD